MDRPPHPAGMRSCTLLVSRALKSALRCSSLSSPPPAPPHRYPGGRLSELGGAMHDFLTDVLHALPADGNQAARWTIKEVPVANLRRFETGLAKMFEVQAG